MLIERIAEWGEATLYRPATEEEIESCEQALQHRCPDELRSLLAETNGIEDEFGTEILWNAERIGEENRNFRNNPDFAELYMPFDSLTFFGDAGDGHQFGVAMRGNLEVYCWNHENDSRTWIAPSVIRFVEDYLSGKLDDLDDLDDLDGDGG
jgi:cell wall assembly regulator SMI1